MHNVDYEPLIFSTLSPAKREGYRAITDLKALMMLFLFPYWVYGWASVAACGATAIATLLTWRYEWRGWWTGISLALVLILIGSIVIAVASSLQEDGGELAFKIMPILFFGLVSLPIHGLISLLGFVFRRLADRYAVDR